MTTHSITSATRRALLALSLAVGAVGFLHAQPAAASSSSDAVIDAQMLVYEINLARKDPDAFRARSSDIVMPAGIPPAPPLAIVATLGSSAAFKANEMADYGYFGHQSAVTGIWPNKLARNHSYPLPSLFADDVNNIESLHGGSPDPFRVLVSFANSESHRRHIFGEGSFFATHRQIGVGRSTNHNYWAVHTAYVNTSDLFITGVVYDDANGNGRMDLGEGLGGVTVSVGTTKTTTNAGGGYAVKVGSGSRTLTVSGGAFVGSATTQVQVDDQNVGVDFVSGADPIAQSLDSSTRLAGPDRYATAVEVSKAHYTNPGQVKTVVLATGEVFPDALAGAALAGRLQAPLLLTTRGSLPQVTRDEIVRLGPSRVLVLGGNAAISSTVLSQVRSLGPTITRLAGADRYETATAISREAFPSTGSVGTVIIATGAGFADALASAPAAVRLDGPVLLTQPSTLPDATRLELERLLPSRVLVLGGTQAISAAVFAEIKAIVPDTVRVAGVDRYATAVEIIKRAFPGSTTPVTSLYITVGTDFPDALTGAAAAAAFGAPVLLTPPTGIPGLVRDEVLRLAPSHLFFLGSASTLSHSLAVAYLNLVD